MSEKLCIPFADFEMDVLYGRKVVLEKECSVVDSLVQAMKEDRTEI